MIAKNRFFLCSTTKKFVRDSLQNLACNYRNFANRVSSARFAGQFYLNDCGGYGQQVVVSPNGELGVCRPRLGEETADFRFAEDVMG